MFSPNTYRMTLKKLYSIRFTLLMALFTGVLLIAGTFEFVPAWILRDPAEDAHLWHIAELGALAVILLAGITAALVRRPEEKLLLAQFVVLSTVILAVGIAPFDFRGAALLLISALLVVAYPNRRALLDFSQKGPMSKALLALTIVFGVLLDPIIQREISYQVNGAGDIHAAALHWIGSALLMVLLIVAGAFASTKRPGWERLAVVTGLTYFYLGVIAMIVPNYAGSWGEGLGLFSVFGGVLYILIMFAELGSMKQSKPAAVSEPKITTEAETPEEAESLAAFEAAFKFEGVSADEAWALAETKERQTAGKA